MKMPLPAKPVLFVYVCVTVMRTCWRRTAMVASTLVRGSVRRSFSVPGTKMMHRTGRSVESRK